MIGSGVPLVPGYLFIANLFQRKTLVVADASPGPGGVCVMTSFLAEAYLAQILFVRVVPYGDVAPLPALGLRCA